MQILAEIIIKWKKKIDVYFHFGKMHKEFRVCVLEFILVNMLQNINYFGIFKLNSRILFGAIDQ